MTVENAKLSSLANLTNLYRFSQSFAPSLLEIYNNFVYY